jgi:hypothetical protein
VRKGGVAQQEFGLSAKGTSKLCDVADYSHPDHIIAFELDRNPSTVVNNIQKNRAVGFKKTIVVIEDQKKRPRFINELEKLGPEYDDYYDLIPLKEFL